MKQGKSTSKNIKNSNGFTTEEKTAWMELAATEGAMIDTLLNNAVSRE